MKKSLIKMAVTSLVLFLAIGWLVSDKNKFSRPSSSIRSAKWRGVFLREVGLSPLPTDSVNSFPQPKEAWLERIYENYESLPTRKGFVGERLAVRFEESSGIDIKPGFQYRLNGVVYRHSGTWNGGNVTVEVPLDNLADFPQSGMIEFFETDGLKELEDGRRSTHQYIVR